MREIPEIRNKRDMPINIFEREMLIYKAESIQDAARWFQQHTNDTNKRFNHICKSFINGTPYLNKYYFITHPDCVKRFIETKENNKKNKLTLHK